MRSRTACRGLALIAGLAVVYGFALMPTTVTAQGTPEQQANCQDDAMRLCGQFVPDVNRLHDCEAAPGQCALSCDHGSQRSTAAARALLRTSIQRQ
jgi:hypothetical protein